MIKLLKPDINYSSDYLKIFAIYSINNLNTKYLMLKDNNILWTIDDLTKIFNITLYHKRRFDRDYLQLLEDRLRLENINCNLSSFRLQDYHYRQFIILVDINEPNTLINYLDSMNALEFLKELKG